MPNDCAESKVKILVLLRGILSNKHTEVFKMSDKKLKVAVTGLSAGQMHVADYMASSSVKELIICDTDKTKLNDTGARYNIQKRYTDFTEMLAKERPDAVSLAVPNFLHMPMSIQAMESGAHVLCEKPMGRNAREAREMKNTAEKCGKILMINYNQRFTPACRALKNIIDAGELGQIYYIRTVWQRQRGIPWWYPLENGRAFCGGGSLIDLGSHMLDRALWLCGYPKTEWVLGSTYSSIASSEASKHGLDYLDLEDMGVAMIRLCSGTMLELEASWASNRENENIVTRIYGTKGGAILYLNDGKIFLDTGKETVEERQIPVQEGPSVRQAFLDAILGTSSPICTPDEGIQLSAVLDAVYLSAQTKMPVHI